MDFSPLAVFIAVPVSTLQETWEFGEHKTRFQMWLFYVTLATHHPASSGKGVESPAKDFGNNGAYSMLGKAGLKAFYPQGIYSKQLHKQDSGDLSRRHSQRSPEGFPRALVLLPEEPRPW